MIRFLMNSKFSCDLKEIENVEMESEDRHKEVPKRGLSLVGNYKNSDDEEVKSRRGRW